MARSRPIKNISEKDLARLLKVVARVVGTPATIRMPADLVYIMAKEISRLRDEVFRIRVCDTVDELLDIDEFFDGAD